MNGVVDKVSAWKSGNGFFFEVGGNTFVGNGSPEIAVGDSITFEKAAAFGKDGKKFFAKNILRVGQGTIEEYVDGPVAEKKPVYQDRSKTIQRLAIMKMAVVLVSAMIEAGRMPESKDSVVLVKEMADELERVV